MIKKIKPKHILVVLVWAACLCVLIQLGFLTTNLQINKLERTGEPHRNLTVTLHGTLGQLKPCQEGPDKGGPIPVNKTLGSLEGLASKYHVQMGGIFRPEDCIPKHKVAIIVPCRNREEHLNIFLRHMHPFLRRQHIEYGIFVVDMAPTLVFVKALAMNVAFLEILKMEDYHCFIFHDIDLIPEDNRIPYACPEQPTHLSVAVDKFNYTLPYVTLYGGVLALRKEHFLNLNGYSNIFFGWGGEDDDLSHRLNKTGYAVKRPPFNVSRYTMLKHKPSVYNPYRHCLIKSSEARQFVDGLNTLDYKIHHVKKFPLYTHILVDADTEVLEKFKAKAHYFCSIVKPAAQSP